jgi:hypothetical protein
MGKYSIGIGRLAIASFCGFSASAAALIALQIARPERSFFHSFVSEFAVGRYGAVMTGVFVVLAASCALLAVAIRRTGEIAARAGLFLVITAAGLLVMADCPTNLNDASPRTLTGSIHDTTSVLTFAAVLGVMASVGWSKCISGSFARLQPLSRRLAVFSAATLAFQLCLLGVQHAHRPYHWVGLSERVLIAAFLAWACLVSAASARHFEEAQFAFELEP